MWCWMRFARLGRRFRPRPCATSTRSSCGPTASRQFKATSYAGTWVVEQFARFGIRCEQSAAPKSDLYRDLLPLLNSGRIELLDHTRLVAQLCQLERRTTRSGKESIDHAPGAHDDIANAVAGAILLAAGDQSAWMRNLKPLLVELQSRPPDPRYAQRRAGRHVQHRHAEFWQAQLGERAAAKMRSGRW